MRFSSAAAVAVATAPLLASAAGRLGFSLGVRNQDGSCKQKEDFRTDFKALSPYTKLVRTYAAVDGGTSTKCYVPSQILPAAAEFGVKVMIGIWPDTDAAFNDDVAEVLKITDDASKSAIEAFTVGSETLYRYQHDQTTGLTADQLINRIESFRNQTKGKFTAPIGTADSWNKFQDGTADSVISHLDIALVNAFGYWQSQDITNASATYIDDLMQAYGQIQKVSGSTSKPRLYNGETGWPTDGGSDYHDPAVSTTAVASTNNAKYFWKNGVCAVLDENFDVFYFEAFSEPWKPDSKGADGQYRDEKHWGAFGPDRNPLWKLSCNYKDEL